MNKFEEIRQYKDLYDNGKITKEEFDQKKAELLGIEANLQDQTVNIGNDGITLSNDEGADSEKIDAPEQEVQNESVEEAVSNEALPDETDTAENVSGNADGEAGKTPEENKSRKKKKHIVMGAAGVIVTVLFILAIFIFSGPELSYISATYNGSTLSGTQITNESDITVTATYDDDTSEDVSGWSVSETTIKPGDNIITIEYKGQSCEIDVFSPLMSGGKFVASVDTIHEVLNANMSEHVSGFTGMEKTEAKGGYKLNTGIQPAIGILYTRKGSGEYVGVEGEEIPESFTVSKFFVPGHYEYLSEFENVCAAAAITFDSSMTFSYAQDLMDHYFDEAVTTENLEVIKGMPTCIYEYSGNNFKIRVSVIFLDEFTTVSCAFENLG